MRLAVIGPTYPYKGGISHFTTLLAQNLRKQHTVDFISWKRQYPSFLYPVATTDTTSKNPLQTKATYLLDFFNPLSWIQAANQINKHNTDLVILTWVSPIQSPIYSIITFFLKGKTKILFICHNVLPHEQTLFDKTLAKLAFRKSDMFIVHSTTDQEKLKKIIGTKKKITLGFHPLYDVFNMGKKINTHKVKNELQLKENVLLFFGYIRPYKGLRYLIEAMPSILKTLPQTSLLIAGEFWSKDKQTYLDLIKKLNLEENIVLVNDYIPNEEVSTYFNLADVVVLPYTSATQSGIAQIAYAFHKPVITTNVGGLSDTAKGLDKKFIIKPRDPIDIAKKVKQFYADKTRPTIHVRHNKTWNDYIQLISL